MHAYFNDEIVDLREKCIQLQDRSYTFGDGLYEVIRIIDGIPIFIDEHLKRLKSSADYFKIKIDELEEIKKKMSNLLKINKFYEGELYIQLSRGTDYFREHGIKDNESNLCILTIPLRDINYENWITGAEVVSYPDLRHGYCSHKTVNLFANVQAKSYAYERNAYEAIMYRTDSFGRYITEGGSSNYFFVKNDTIFTPELDNILPGITREKAINLIQEMGEKVVQKRFYYKEINECNEVFLVSTVSKIMPVKKIDEYNFDVGLKTKVLKNKFNELIETYKKNRE